LKNFVYLENYVSQYAKFDMTLICKKCSSSELVKNGKVREQQRYKCKECGYNSVVGDKRERHTISAKAMALLLYGSCKSSYGMIAKLFGVSRPTVLNWIRSMVKDIPEPEVPSEVEAIQIDEMWHFINKKNKKFGSGEPWIVFDFKPSDGLLAIVMLKHLNSSMKN